MIQLHQLQRFKRTYRQAKDLRVLLGKKSYEELFGKSDTANLYF